MVLAFTAPAQIAVSQANFSVVNNSTVSPSVTRVGNGYTYCVKPAAQACLDADYSDLLNGTGPIPSPAAVVPPNYWLRIRYNYTIAGITQPPAQWTPSALGVSDNTAWPFTVSSQIPEIRFNCTVGFGCTDVGKITVNAGDVFTAYAYVNGSQDNSTSISWSAPGASQGDGSTQNGAVFRYSTEGTYTLTLNGYGSPVNATVHVTFTLPPGSEGPYSLFILDPCRVLDTRNPVGPLGGPAIQPAGTPDRTLAVGSFCGIPFDAKAISANVTVTNVLAMGVVSIYRGDGQPTGTNTVALAAGRTRANNAILQLALDGSGTIKVQNTSSGTLDLIIDVNGYFR